MITVTHRTHPDGTFYKAVERIIYDEDIQDNRLVSYGTVDDKEFFVEVYQGPNYVVDCSSKRSWSRKYKMREVPSKLNQVVSILRHSYSNNFQDA
jgi:hypothetical protein